MEDEVHADEGEGRGKKKIPGAAGYAEKAAAPEIFTISPEPWTGSQSVATDPSSVRGRGTLLQTESSRQTDRRQLQQTPLTIRSRVLQTLARRPFLLRTQ